jgi:hypothetical protein
VRQSALFSGTLRNDLVSMLDGVEIATAPDIDSSAGLFSEPGDHLVHEISTIRYPVFKGENNCTGSTPPILGSPVTSLSLNSRTMNLTLRKRRLSFRLGSCRVVSWRSHRCWPHLPHAPPNGVPAHVGGQWKQAPHRPSAEARPDPEGPGLVPFLAV